MEVDIDEVHIIDEDMVESVDEVAVPHKDLFSIDNAQQRHGLRHGDYQRYRQYCSRRLARIRKALHFPQGTHKRVTPKRIQASNITDARYLHILLVEAERCWSYAMQLKVDSSSDRRKMFHLKSKIRKAVAYADELNKLCAECHRVDAKTKLEAQAYAEWMHALLQFELRNWPEAIALYAKVKLIYEKLAATVAGESKTVYEARLAEMQPNVRYAHYSVGDTSQADELLKLRGGEEAGAANAALVDELIAKTRERQAATMSELTWQGRTVPVKNEQVRLFLLSMQEWLAADAPERTIQSYERLLRECTEASLALREQLINEPTPQYQTYRGACDALAANAAEATVEVTSTHYLYVYLQFTRLVRSIERNQMLINECVANLVDTKDATPTSAAAAEQAPQKKTHKPQDLVRLYDIVIQNLTELQALHLVSETTVSATTLRAHLAACQALRCYYLARVFASQRRWAEAVALAGRALERAKPCLSFAVPDATADPTHAADVVGESVRAMTAAAEDLRFSARAGSLMDQQAAPGSFPEGVAGRKPPATVPLTDRMDDYYMEAGSARPYLVALPPEMKPIPVKPIFFDLAQKHVTLPNLDEQLDDGARRKGLTGLVSGWLWGGGGGNA